MTRSGPDLGGPAPRRLRWWAGAFLAASIVVVAVEAWLPLGPSVSYAERVAPVMAAKEVTFAGRSVLVGEPAPEWLATATRTGELEVALTFRASTADQDGPARLLTITEDVRHANLMIGQQGSDLFVRVRRPGSDPSGDPPFRITDAIAPGAWRTLLIQIRDGRLHVELDDRTRIDEPLDAGRTGHALAGWDPSYRLALGDEPDGDREWAGEVRAATIRTGDSTVDLLQPGTLEAGTGSVRVVRARHVLRPPDESIALVVLRAAIFVPVGAALALLLRRRTALLTALCVPAVLALGKLFVAGRHASVTEVLVGAAGALVGVGLGRLVIRRARAQSDGAQIGLSARRDRHRPARYRAGAGSV